MESASAEHPVVEGGEFGFWRGAVFVGERGFEFCGEPVDFGHDGIGIDFGVVESGDEDGGAWEIAWGFVRFGEKGGEVCGGACGVGVVGEAAESGGAFFEIGGGASGEVACERGILLHEGAVGVGGGFAGGEAGHHGGDGVGGSGGS